MNVRQVSMESVPNGIHPLHHPRFSRLVVVEPGGCWIWCGASSGGGGVYGNFFWNGRATLAHRVVYQMVNGPIPEGLTIDHLCRQTKCVNPAHLEAVPMRVNVLRGETIVARQASQTHCLRGHDLSVAYVYRGKRYCTECQRICRRARGAA